MSKRNKRRYNTTNTTKTVDETIKNVSENTEINNLKDSKDTDNVLVIRRKCKPGDTNVNGVTYTKESYTEVMNKKIIPMVNEKKLSCEIFFGTDNPYNCFAKDRFCFIDPANSACNKVINICDDYVEVEFNDMEMYNIIKTAMISNNVSVDMRYFGELKDKDKKVYEVTEISAFDIIVVGDYPYKDYTSYIAYINE